MTTNFAKIFFVKVVVVALLKNNFLIAWLKKERQIRRQRKQLRRESLPRRDSNLLDKFFKQGPILSGVLFIFSRYLKVKRQPSKCDNMGLFLAN